MLKHIPFYASLLGKELTETVTAKHPHVLLYGAIEAHSYGHLGCIAGNETLGEETGVSPENVRRYLNDMKKGGWISYNLDKANNRDQIVPLLEIATPSVKNTQGGSCKKYTRVVQKLHKPCVEITHIDNIIGNSEVTEIKATATPVASLKATKVKSKVEKPKALTVEDPTVNQVIELFKVVDLNYTVLYARKTERTAVETLIKLHSPQEIADVLNKAVIYNKLPFVTSYDKIYKPTDLLRNWQKLQDKEAEIVLKPKIAQKEANDKAKTRVAGW